MQYLKRWLCLSLTLALSAALALPVRAADPLADTFANFLIDAATTDSPETTLSIDLYSRDSSAVFQRSSSVQQSCMINRLAGPSKFYVQSNADGVWVEVEYLTDLDGNGTFEMLDGEDSPVCDVMTANGTLLAWDGTVHPLTGGQTYILSSEALQARGQEILSARRSADSGQAISDALTVSPEADTVLYLLSLHYISPSDGEEYVLYYYLRLFDSIIIPSDISKSAWYYDAVEYVLSEGLFSGTGVDSFSPAATVTRAQLAQILWRMGGSELAGATAFPDVAPSAWYYNAVAWCSQTNLMSGSDAGFFPDSPLTREQLAVVLRQYAAYAGLNTSGGVILSRFTDGAATSVWARGGVEWAVEQGFLTGYDDGSLSPAGAVTRAQLAAVLRTFCQRLPDENTTQAPAD